MSSQYPGSGPDDDDNLPPTHQAYGAGSGPDPYGPPPSQAPYGQDPYGQDKYGQQPGSDPGSYGQNPYGQQPYGYGQAGPKHPSATTAMVLGIIALAGGFFCGLPFLLAPFAWSKGSRAVREIDASGGGLSGREQANAGRIMGIIGTVLLGLGLLALVVVVVLGVAIGGTSVEYGTGTRAG